MSSETDRWSVSAILIIMAYTDGSVQDLSESRVLEGADVPLSASQPTVLLVKPGPLNSHNSLPLIQTDHDSDDRGRPNGAYLSSTASDGHVSLFSPSGDEHVALDVDLDEGDFIPVELTPRPDCPTRSSSVTFIGSISSGTTAFSLPTPDFKTGRRPSVLTRIRSSFSSLRNATTANSSAASSPACSGSTAALNCNGRGYSAANMSIKASIAPADKFTRKWPRPRSLRHPPSSFAANSSLIPKGGAGRFGGWSESEMKAALMEGKGLGIDWSGRWTPHKWCLLLSVTSVFVCGLGGIICSLLTWFTAYTAAPMLLITDSPILILLTVTSSLLLLSSVIGTTGTLLNSRPFLAVYALLLFPAFFSLASIGYISYRKSHFALDRKLSEAWSAWYSPGARLVIQSSLQCCGWANALHGAAPSGTCYPRTPLPGCRNALLDFERTVLPMAYGIAFSLVPLHIASIITALLCANHVTRRFGKGIMPRRYRLHAGDVASIHEQRATDAHRSEVSTITTIGMPEVACATATGLGLFREDRQDSRRRVSLGIRR
ncbi:hypothetical protein EW146_g3513 [Bondarzewia mesenterica]|uniref:Tetraspanin Tsp2 n=1 Tax=Bondarzewia mesenterica TaxID=1095465 RepID=A0A4S4LZI8_9AGAM|nr:hypothetical protein EW146_g3513 [Bondarzewia mesenterica]